MACRGFRTPTIRGPFLPGKVGLAIFILGEILGEPIGSRRQLATQSGKCHFETKLAGWGLTRQLFKSTPLL